MLETELNKYGGLLEKADALGRQLTDDSGPDDVRTVRRMIDEYRTLWTDISYRTAKLKTTCVRDAAAFVKKVSRMGLSTPLRFGVSTVVASNQEWPAVG